jgi:hypothetical protein
MAKGFEPQGRPNVMAEGAYEIPENCNSFAQEINGTLIRNFS